MQAVARQDRFQKRAAQAGGRTEKPRPLAGQFSQARRAGFDFTRHATRAECGEMKVMVLAVVFYRMAAPDDFAAQLG